MNKFPYTKPCSCGECQEEHTGEILVCEENRRKIIFHKPGSRIAKKIRIDGCRLRQQKACDFLVQDWEQRQHFVELKGADIKTAVKQLEATLEFFRENRALEAKLWCFVITSRTFPQVLSFIQTAKSRFKKDWNARLITKNDQINHVLENITGSDVSRGRDRGVNR